MISRKIGALVRGNATPFQIISACVFGSLLGFLPGIQQGPGLFLLWLALLVVVNANLFLAGVVGLAAKLLALAVAPATFAVGRMLLEGPLRGFFAKLVNGPVTFGFVLEYHLVSGGGLLGLVFGVVSGVGIVVLLRWLWRRLAALQAGSEAFVAWSSRRWVRVLAWVFVGGAQARHPYEELLARRWGNPVRVFGMVLVVLLGVLGWVGMGFLDSVIVTTALRGALERVNGATVDLRSVEVSLGEGRVAIQGLALADPERLETDLFAAESLEAKLSVGDLLRRRAVVDTVRISGAEQGRRRALPGRRVGPEPEEEQGAWEWPDMSSLEQIFAQPKIWKQRLQTAKRWLDRLNSEGPTEVAESEVATPSPVDDGGPRQPTYEEILRERLEHMGYAAMRDERLVQGAPRLLVREIVATAVRAEVLPGDMLDIRAENLATEPRLIKQAASLLVTSASGRLRGVLKAPAGAAPQIQFFLSGLAVDALVASLRKDEQPSLQGGTLDFAAQGSLGATRLELPVSLTLRNTQLALGGSKPTPIEKLIVPVTVRGTLTRPAIRVDSKGLKEALAAAGKRELSNRLQEEIEKKLGGEKQDESLKKAAGGLLDGLLKPKKP